MRLARVRAPFDHPDWIFELKYDGFTALLYVEHGRARLVSHRFCYGISSKARKSMFGRVSVLVPMITPLWSTQ